MAVTKRPPVPDGWERKAYCYQEDQNATVWDLDVPYADDGDGSREKTFGQTRKARKHCILDCVVRIECLRLALRQSAEGVIRGGVAFDSDQHRKKKSVCLFCEYPIAPLTVDQNGNKLKAICNICRKYAPCLKGCGRMVVRKPNMSSYYCPRCAE